MKCNHIELISGNFEGVAIDTMEWLEAGWVVNHVGMHRYTVHGIKVPHCYKCGNALAPLQLQGYMAHQYAIDLHIKDLTCSDI